jgi:glycerol-3-phosphate acyltransferase PlsY
MSPALAQGVVALTLSYLVGAIPWSWLAGRYIGGLDLRQVGSGNLGASNTFRALGARVALPVLLLDIMKGVAAALGFARLAPDGGAATASLWATLCGVVAIIGHMFPVYLGFRGGKGIATAAGAFGALEPLAFGVSGVVFLLAFAATRGIVSVGSLLGTLALPIAMYVIGARAGTLEPARLWVVCVLVLVVWIKHASNISRLRHGSEKSVLRRR